MEGREPAQGLGLQFYFRYGGLEVKNCVVGDQTMCKVGNQRRTIWRARSQCRSCDYNSTSGLVSSVPTLLTWHFGRSHLCGRELKLTPGKLYLSAFASLWYDYLALDSY